MSLSPTQFDQPSGVRTAAVAVYDTNGVQLSGFDQSRPANATLATVAVTTTTTPVLASNPARRQVIIVNEASKTVFVAFAATASVTAYTISIAGGATYVGEINGYTGAMSAIMASGSGNLRVTEITT